MNINECSFNKLIHYRTITFLWVFLAALLKIRKIGKILTIDYSYGQYISLEIFI